MGTNYYWYEKELPFDGACPTCGHERDSYEGKHIGKSSGGWCFGLHVIPEEGINTLEDWERLWNQPGTEIRDEYGEKVSPAEMKRTITERKWRDFDARDWSKYVVYKDEEDFHRKNQSERGPNELLRHQIGRHCVGHGEGTYDYIVGEFS